MRDYKIWNSDIGKVFIDRQNKEVGVNIEKSDEYPSYSCSKCRNTFSDGDNVKSIKDFHMCRKCMQDLDFKDQDAIQAERERFGKQKDYTTAKNININECDFCKQGRKSEKAIYDGKTKFGPWAGMCEEHFKEHGLGLGLGKGQRLI